MQIRVTMGTEPGHPDYELRSYSGNMRSLLVVDKIGRSAGDDKVGAQGSGVVLVDEIGQTCEDTFTMVSLNRDGLHCGIYIELIADTDWATVDATVQRILARHLGTSIELEQVDLKQMPVRTVDLSRKSGTYPATPHPH